MVHTQRIELFTMNGIEYKYFFKEKYTVQKTDWSTKMEIILMLCYENRIGTRRR